MQVFRRLVTFSVVPTNLGMFSSLDALLEMAHRSLCLCIQLCWKSRTEVMTSSLEPAQLDTKAAGIPVAQVSPWENHWTVFFMPEHWVSAVTTWKSTFLKYCQETEFINRAVT